MSGAQVTAFCRTILKLAPQKPDIEALRELFCDFAWPTLSAVAKSFGVSANTVNQSWRNNGLPGKPGEWPAVEIVVWLIERNRREAARDDAAPDPHRQRVREIELARSELELRRLVREEDASEGVTINRVEAVAALGSLLSRGGEWLGEIAGEVEPMLPSTCAKEISSHIQRSIADVLQRLSEMSSRELGLEAQYLRELIEERGLRRVNDAQVN